jgi:hypothetical protein
VAIPLPAWVDVKPSDFVAAAEGGARIGAQMNDIATNAALKRAEIAQQAQEASIRAASDAQTHELEGQRMAIQSAQEQSQIGLAKQKAEQESEQVGRLYQAQQSADTRTQQLVAAGVPPLEARLRATMEVGPESLGDTLSGVVSLAKDVQSSNFVPHAIQVPGVGPVLMGSPGHASAVKLPQGWEQTTDNGVQVQRNAVTGEERALPGTQRPSTDLQNENEVIRLNTQRDKLMSDNERYSEMLETGDPPDPSWTKEQKAQYSSLKKRLSDIDTQIDRFSGTPPMDTGTVTGTNSTSSGLKYSIVPAQ